MKFLFEALIKFTFGVVIFGALIFWPAGTFEFWNGWLLMGLLFVPMFIAEIVMMIKSPELLRKRLNVKEKEDEQKQVVLFSGLMFFAGFIISGLNYRYRLMNTRALLQSKDHSVGSKRYLSRLEKRVESFASPSR